VEESDRSSGFPLVCCPRPKIVNDRHPNPNYVRYGDCVSGDVQDIGCCEYEVIRNIPIFDEERATAQIYSKVIKPFGDTPPSSPSPEDSPVAGGWIR